jgi:hypothetical protein
MAARAVEVYGHRLLVERTPDGWQAFHPSAEGKRAPALRVPAFVVTDDELLEYLADLWHESARPDRSVVRWIR